MYLFPVIKITTILLVFIIIDVSSKRWYPPGTNVIDRFSIPDNDNTKDDDRIWFPGQKNPVGTRYNNMNHKPQNRGSEAVDSKCDEEKFCEDVPNYPTNLVNRILEEQPHLYNYQIKEKLELKPRISEPVQLCLSIQQVKYPRKAQAMNGEYLFIINTSNFTQRIVTETCINENTPCQLINEFVEGYATSCKQKYITRQLLALNGNEADHRTFLFPSSCCCHVVSNHDTIARSRLSRN